jgi:hypothetical protein
MRSLTKVRSIKNEGHDGPDVKRGSEGSLDQSSCTTLCKYYEIFTSKQCIYLIFFNHYTFLFHNLCFVVKELQNMSQ